MAGNYLLGKIKLKRNALKKTLMQKNLNLQDETVLKLSKELDILIIKYITMMNDKKTLKQNKNGS